MSQTATQLVSQTLLQSPQFQNVLMAQCTLQALALSQAQGSPKELAEMFESEKGKVVASIEQFCHYLENKWNSDINRDLIQCIRSLEAEVQELREAMEPELDQADLARELKTLWTTSNGDTELMQTELNRIQTHGVKHLEDGTHKFYFRHFVVELSQSGYIIQSFGC